MWLHPLLPVAMAVAMAYIVFAGPITDEVHDILPNSTYLPFAGRAIDTPDSDVVTASSSYTKVEYSTMEIIEKAFGTFEKNVTALPSNGQASRPMWANTYWPKYLDSINYRYNGSETLAPSEKYALAFNLDVTQVKQEISQRFGVASTNKTSTPCSSDTMCQQGFVCGKREGYNTGYCISTWEGICDGWVASSLVFAEPACDVQHNGVTFTRQDLKALLSLLFADVSPVNYHAIMLANRCNEKSPSLNNNGQYANADCHDITPGMFHLFVTNIIGRYHRPCAFDQTATIEVWNQPVTGYNILRKEEISKQLLSQLVGPNYLHSSAATRFFHVQLQLRWVTETAFLVLAAREDIIENFYKYTIYEYVLEVDDDDNVVGGEWIGSSKTDHPDFVWVVDPNSVNKQWTTSGGISFKNLEYLVGQSRLKKCPRTGVMSFSNTGMDISMLNRGTQPATSNGAPAAGTNNGANAATSNVAPNYAGTDGSASSGATYPSTSGTTGGYQQPVSNGYGNAASGYGTNGYGTNGYGTTGYGTTGYGATGYGTYGYGNTGYGNTGYSPAGYGATGSGTTGSGSTGYGASNPYGYSAASGYGISGYGTSSAGNGYSRTGNSGQGSPGFGGSMFGSSSIAGVYQ